MSIKLKTKQNIIKSSKNKHIVATVQSLDIIVIVRVASAQRALQINCSGVMCLCIIAKAQCIL